MSACCHAAMRFFDDNILRRYFQENFVQVCVYLSNWSHVLTYVNKAEASSDFTDKDRDSSNQASFTKLKYVFVLLLNIINPK